MKCPDCATTLTLVSVAGFDKSYRCFTCGGFWTEPSSVNRISAVDLTKIARIKPDKSMLKFGTDTCPVDGLQLSRFMGESVPMNVVVKRCTKCGFWWWPGDNLIKYKPAQEAKISYFKQWGIPTDLSALTLPVLVLGLLAVGLGLAVISVKDSQKVTIEAGVGVQQFSATYLGNGSELVSFKSREAISSLEYARIGDGSWQVAVVEDRGGIYIVTLEGLIEDTEYKVRILGREYKFVTQ